MSTINNTTDELNLACGKCEEGWAWVTYDDEPSPIALKEPCPNCRPPKALGYIKDIRKDEREKVIREVLEFVDKSFANGWRSVNLDQLRDWLEGRIGNKK